MHMRKTYSLARQVALGMTNVKVLKSISGSSSYVQWELTQHLIETWKNKVVCLNKSKKLLGKFKDNHVSIIRIHLYKGLEFWIIDVIWFFFLPKQGSSHQILFFKRLYTRRVQWFYIRIGKQTYEHCVTSLCLQTEKEKYMKLN